MPRLLLFLSMQSHQVFDNFLTETEFQSLKNAICFNKEFPFYLYNDVTFHDKVTENWSWYGVHILYSNSVPNSPYFKDIFNIFNSKIKEIIGFKSLIRIKINFYPHTETLKEHSQHSDYPYAHNAAIFSLNTCDGFTRILDDIKVDSIENRMLFFDGSLPHNSTTTTHSGRFNINFNWI